MRSLKRTGIVIVATLAVTIGSQTQAGTPVTRAINDDNAYLIASPLSGLKENGRTPQSAKRLARAMGHAYGWHTNKQWSCWAKLWGKESAWNYKADNPTSSAYGIPQILGLPTHLKPRKQIYRGIKYIKHKYDNPCNAWAHWLNHNWY